MDVEIDFTPEQFENLSRIATHEGKNPAQLVKDAVLHLLDEDARFQEAVQQGIDEANRGDLIDHEEVRRRIDRDHITQINEGLKDIRAGRVVPAEQVHAELQAMLDDLRRSQLLPGSSASRLGTISK